jgi:hypothetical protein
MVTATYFAVEGCAGKKFFKCAPLAATISTTTCESNWRKAQTLTPDAATPIQRCVACPLGAKHCGTEIVHRSALFATTVCPRCRRGGARMIAGRLCISCQNRAYEYRKGRNGKGSRPALTLDPRRVGVVVGYGGTEQRYVELRDDLTKDQLELVVQALRITPGRIAFQRPRGRPPISTAELAEQHSVAERQPGASGIFAMFKRAQPAKNASPPRPTSRQAPPVDHLPNEFRARSHPRAIDPGATLARLLARRAS